MKPYILTAGAFVAACLSTMAVAGGPDHMPVHHGPWHIDMAMLGGVNYTSGHAKNFTLTTPGNDAKVPFTGTTADFLTQVGGRYRRIGFGATLEFNNGSINAGSNLNEQVQTIKDMTSVGGYLSYMFMKMHRHSMTIIGTLTGTAWNIHVNEVPRGNNSYEASRYGVSESVGLRYAYCILPHMQVLAQMTTEFHQLNTTVTSSLEQLNFQGTAAVTTNFLAGVRYSFAM